MPDRMKGHRVSSSKTKNHIILVWPTFFHGLSPLPHYTNIFGDDRFDHKKNGCHYYIDAFVFDGPYSDLTCLSRTCRQVYRGALSWTLLTDVWFIHRLVTPVSCAILNDWFSFPSGFRAHFPDILTTIRSLYLRKQMLWRPQMKSDTPPQSKDFNLFFQVPYLINSLVEENRNQDRTTGVCDPWLFRIIIGMRRITNWLFVQATRWHFGLLVCSSPLVQLSSLSTPYKRNPASRPRIEQSLTVSPHMNSWMNLLWKWQLWTMLTVSSETIKTSNMGMWLLLGRMYLSQFPGG